MFVLFCHWRTSQEGLATSWKRKEDSYNKETPKEGTKLPLNRCSINEVYKRRAKEKSTEAEKMDKVKKEVVKNAKAAERKKNQQKKGCQK